MQGAAVYNGVMTDRYIIANGGTAFFKSAVDTGPVLYIDLMAHTNKIYIAPQNCIEPDTAIVSHHHIAYHGRVGG